MLLGLRGRTEKECIKLVLSQVSLNAEETWLQDKALQCRSLLAK